MDNSSLLGLLLNQGKIALEPSYLLTRVPPPLPEEWDFVRAEGMLLGPAIGDALGNTTESQLPATRGQSHGEIRDYLPNRYANSRPMGVPSDDSQMVFWTLKRLLKDVSLIPGRLARKFTQQQIFGIGNTVKAFPRSCKEQGLPWEESGQPSTGNGALMRIAPMLTPHLRQPSPALWAIGRLWKILAGLAWDHRVVVRLLHTLRRDPLGFHRAAVFNPPLGAVRRRGSGHPSESAAGLHTADHAAGLFHRRVNRLQHPAWNHHRLWRRIWSSRFHVPRAVSNRALGRDMDRRADLVRLALAAGVRPSADYRYPAWRIHPELHPAGHRLTLHIYLSGIRICKNPQCVDRLLRAYRDE